MVPKEKATEGSGPAVASKTYCERHNNLICSILKIIVMKLYNWQLLGFKTTERVFQQLGLYKS